MERELLPADPATSAQDTLATSRALTAILVRALRGLGEAGRPDEASRLAARAWSATRRSDPTTAERINGTMHYLARLPDPINTPHLDQSIQAFARKGE